MDEHRSSVRLATHAHSLARGGASDLKGSSGHEANALLSPPRGYSCPTRPETRRARNGARPRPLVSGRGVSRAPRLQTSCKCVGLSLQTSRKHLTAETQRNRAKPPAPIRQTFGAFRPCSPTFAHNSLYRGERFRSALLCGFRGACGPTCGPHTATRTSRLAGGDPAYAIANGRMANYPHQAPQSCRSLILESA